MRLIVLSPLSVEVLPDCACVFYTHLTAGMVYELCVQAQQVGNMSATMAHIGQVDYDALIRDARGGLWSDPDFPAGEHAIWIDGQRSGFGAISAIGQVRCPRPTSNLVFFGTAKLGL